MADKIQELRDKRAAVLAKAKVIRDSPAGADGDATPGQAAEVNGLCDQAGAWTTEIQRLEAENSVLRSPSVSGELSSEKPPGSGGGTERPRDGESSYRPSAPVYDHNAIDPATRGD